MEELTVEMEIQKPEKVDEKDSLRIPKVVVDSSPVKDMIRKFENNDEQVKHMSETMSTSDSIRKIPD